MTNAKRLDGKAMAGELAESISARTAGLVERTGIKPGLTVVIVGEDPASQVYVRNKQRTAEACGFNSVQHSLPEDTVEEDVLALINDLNNDPAVHGILVQLPLPNHLDEQSLVPFCGRLGVFGRHFANPHTVIDPLPRGECRSVA